MIASNRYNYVYPEPIKVTVTGSATKPVGWVPGIGITLQMDMKRAIEATEELAAALRRLGLVFRKKRKRNKSTVPTALLTRKCPRMGCIASRPNQKASSYG